MSFVIPHSLAEAWTSFPRKDDYCQAPLWDPCLWQDSWACLLSAGNEDLWDPMVVVLVGQAHTSHLHLSVPSSLHPRGFWAGYQSGI